MQKVRGRSAGADGAKGKRVWEEGWGRRGCKEEMEKRVGAIRGPGVAGRGEEMRGADKGKASQHLRSPLSKAPRDCSLLAAEEAKRYSPAQALTTMR